MTGLVREATTTVAFLAQLRSLNVIVRLEGGRLQVSAPKKVLTPELRERLTARKADILAFLSDTGELQRPELQAIDRIPRDGALPVSFAQMRLWFLDQLTPGAPTYIISLANRIRGKLNFSAFERSLSEIVRRHEVLRTVFSMNNGWPSQVILPPAPVPTDVIDLAHVPVEQRESEARRLAAAAAREPFDLSKGPLLRTSLLRLDEEDHVFLFTVHHAVFDGWSIGVFWRDFASLYGAFRDGAPSPLPELPIQYADFAAWQKRRLDGPLRESHMSYWKQRLGGNLPVLALPADRPRRESHALHSAQRTLRLSPAVSESLKSLSQREGASLFMTLLAAFNILLRRLSGQDDIVVGTPIAGRDRAELELMAGFFVNTIVIRTLVSGGSSFRDLLAQIRDNVLDAHRHQDMPFEELVGAFDPQRDINRSPLFQVFFNHLNLQIAPVRIPGLEVEPFGGFNVESKFDLTLYSNEQGDAVQFLLLYNADRFDERRMAILLDQYADLLEQISEDPLRPVDQYSLVTGSTRDILPDPAAPIEVRRFPEVHSRFVELAAQSPDRGCLEDASARWSYGQLEGLSAGLASWLRARGIGAGDTVAVYAHRSAPLVLALLGVLRAGAAFCILDPAYPAARLMRCLRTARPKAWLQIAAAGDLPGDLDTAVDEMVRDFRLTLPAADKALSMPELSARSHLPQGPDHDSPAYLTFTSGTTGEPKCIRGTHRPLSHFVDWHVREFDLKDTDRFSMLSGLAHDPLLRDVFTPLSIGATLSIPAPDDILSPGQLSRWMEQRQITAAHLTPAMGALLAQPSGRPEEVLKPLSDLRYAFFGGDALTFRDVTRLASVAPRAQCISFYGATETPQAMAWRRVDPAVVGTLECETDPTRRIPIGSPIAGVQTLILNRAGGLAGIGELGEIHIRTPYLSQGYVNDEALTRERFLINPVTRQDSDRIYKTGDLGRYRPDGLVEFAGRADRQIKIRGYRIEPGEIEAALMDHSGIRDCAVVAREDRSGSKRLVAYLAARNGHRFTPEELREYLGKFLPGYAIPSDFVGLPAMPLTPNGKVDRRALALREDGAQPVEGYAPPCDQVERQMTEIWKQVLGVDRVGVLDNFFELGGESLSATRLVARLRSAFQMDLPLRCLFIDPTIRGLSKHIRYDVSTQAYRYASELPSWNCLVPAQPRGARTPFFFVAGYQSPDDTLLVLSRFIPHLGLDQPVYGLRPRWAAGGGEGYATVEDAARDFLSELRTVQPAGPYLLGGQCVGGVVALEMARQLVGEGEEVGLLALLDTERPSAFRAFLANVRLMYRRGRNIASVISGIVLQPNGQARRDGIRALVRRKLGNARAKQAATLAADRFYELKIGYRRLAYSHSPGEYPGRIDLFVNEEEYRFNRGTGWKRVARGGVNVHKISGDHDTILTLHGREFAQVLRQCIDDALRGPRQRTDRTGGDAS